MSGGIIVLNTDHGIKTQESVPDSMIPTIDPKQYANVHIWKITNKRQPCQSVSWTAMS